MQIPKELRGDFDLIFEQLKRLRDDFVTRRTLNPAYVAPAEGAALDPNAAPRYLFEDFALTADERDLAHFKISKLCAPLVKTLHT
jgi:hypothetical protein